MSFSKYEPQRPNRGFTIIEVMIVLAIAALILLIVLLAVPALQRNSRNTAIKNDASAIVAAISTYESNNNGAALTTFWDIRQSGATVTVGRSGTKQAEAKVQAGDKVVRAYTLPPSGPLTPGTIRTVIKKDCDGNTSTRSVAVWYSIETSKGVPSSSPWNNKCINA